MKLIDGKTSVFNGLASNRTTLGFQFHDSVRASAKEPLRVRVRVRQDSYPAPATGQFRAGPEQGRLAVGSILDCYI
jgi:hypothetical protein